MTCGVLLVALACGQVMQSLGDNPLTRNEKGTALPSDPAATHLAPPPVMQGRTQNERVVRIKVVSHPEMACIPQLKLKRAPSAMIDLSFIGCKARQLVLRHGDVEITTATDSSGHLERRIPAFSSEVRVSVAFDGETIESAITIPDADDFQHVAIVWKGPKLLHLHAFEFGAKHDQFGHVWAKAPKSPERASRGTGGFLTSVLEHVEQKQYVKSPSERQKFQVKRRIL